MMHYWVTLDGEKAGNMIEVESISEISQEEYLKMAGLKMSDCEGKEVALLADPQQGDVLII